MRSELQGAAVLVEEPELVEVEPERYVQIGILLKKSLKKDFLTFLRQNADVFASSPSEMPGIDVLMICHHLNVNLTWRPVRQKKRNEETQEVKSYK